MTSSFARSMHRIAHEMNSSKLWLPYTRLSGAVYWSVSISLTSLQEFCRAIFFTNVGPGGNTNSTYHIFQDTLYLAFKNPYAGMALLRPQNQHRQGQSSLGGEPLYSLLTATSIDSARQQQHEIVSYSILSIHLGLHQSCRLPAPSGVSESRRPRD